MLSMLCFCPSINYHSVWHAAALRRQGAESSSKARRTVMGRKHAFDQSAQTSKRSTETERVKQKWRTLRFECLLLSFAFIAKKKKKKSNLNATAARRNDDVILVPGDSVCHLT